MKGKIFLTVFVAMLFLAVSVSAQFTASEQHIALTNVYLDDNVTTVMTWLSFHESSESVGWYIRKHPNDISTNDNHTIVFDCGGSITGSFSTSDYEDWNNFGFVHIVLDYEDESYSISYDESPFTAKYLRCKFTASSGAFINNSAYDYITMELIPSVSSFEFISCSGVSSAQISLAEEIGFLVTMMSEIWEIAWLIYSIFIILIAVFGIPILFFMLIRYVVFRLSGYRIGGEREA